MSRAMHGESEMISEVGRTAIGSCLVPAHYHVCRPSTPGHSRGKRREFGGWRRWWGNPKRHTSSHSLRTCRILDHDASEYIRRKHVRAWRGHDDERRCCAWLGWAGCSETLPLAVNVPIGTGKGRRLAHLAAATAATTYSVRHCAGRRWMMRRRRWRSRRNRIMARCER